VAELARYELDEGIATIAMDDGKVNALSPAMIGAVAAAFDRAEQDGAVALLTGRERTFSAGFDLRCEPARWPSNGSPARPASGEGRYFSSAELFPSSWRAMISSWICWVPSNRSRIFASRAHFSSSSSSP
jgi:enoyl-CoA hydratase/carnithine racemase